MSESAHIIDSAREISEPGGESGVVLQRQDRGRHKHGDLLAVSDSLESRPDSNLGLAEADITADNAESFGRNRKHSP